MMITHQQNPDAPNLPEDRKNAILHATIEIGGAVLMSADIPHAELMRAAYLTLRLSTAEEAEKLYAILGEGGQIFMKMEETFFATRFTMLRDNLELPGCLFAIANHILLLSCRTPAQVYSKALGKGVFVRICFYLQGISTVRTICSVAYLSQNGAQASLKNLKIIYYSSARNYTGLKEMVEIDFL